MSIIKTVEEIRRKLNIRLDADDEEQPKPKKHSALSTRLPYALCKESGIDTEGMTPREAWEAYEGKTGKSAESAKSEKMGESMSKTQDRITELKSRIDDVVGKKKEHSNRVREAKGNLQFREMSLDTAKKELDEARGKLNPDFKDVSDDELESTWKDQEKKVSDLYEWLESHKKKFSEMTDEEREERRAKRAEKSEIEEEYYKYTDEYYQRKSVKNREEDFNKASKKVDDAKKVLSDIEAEGESFEDDSEMRAEYAKLADRRNKAVLKKFKSVDDCKTSGDVSDYLRAKGYYNYKEIDDAYENDVSVNLDEMDVKSAKAFANRVDKIFSDYPFLSGNVGGISCKDLTNDKVHGFENTYAFATGTSITFNKDYFGGSKNGAELYEENVKSGWHPQGTTVNSIPDHEYTHVMENLVNERLGDGKKAADIIMQRVQERLDGSYLPENEDYYRFQVSEYAYKNRGITRGVKGEIIEVDKVYGGNTEWLAEAMSEARTSKNPREIAVTAREEFEKLMREVKLL